MDVGLEVDDPAGFGFEVDELLYRACREGLRNVERHAQAGSVTVSVRREGSIAVLEVRDDGIGIGPAETSGPDDGGDGHFGLRIVGDLVADAGGRLTVVPASGHGTVLRVEVPIPSIRVAIADDHRVVRVGLEQLLRTFDDVELVGAADGGIAAVDLCSATTPDVLLLDLSMPDLDGIGVTRRVGDVAPATRVVLFTSFSDREGIVGALDAGAIGYLLKDAEPERSTPPSARRLAARRPSHRRRPPCCCRRGASALRAKSS